MFAKSISIIAPVLVLSILIIIHELFHFLACRRLGVRVERFSLGFGPRLFGIKRGDTDYCLSAIPLGGYVKMAGEEAGDKRTGEKWEYLGQPVGGRAQIVIAGPLGNFVLAYLIFVAIMIAGYPVLTTRISEPMKDFPAAAAGLQKDDRIVALNGKKLADWEDMLNRMEREVRGPAEFIIERGGAQFEITITPKMIEHTDLFGRKRIVSRIGVLPSGEIVTVKHRPGGALYLSGVKVVQMSGQIVQSFWALITRRVPAKDAISGPVGVFQLMKEATELGIIPLAYIAAALSVMLAILNIFPFPALDGGHLLFLAIEKIRKRPLNRKIQEAATEVGFALLILLMLFVTYNDVVKLVRK